MPLMEEMDRRFLHLESKTGVFVIGAVIGILLLVLFIGIQHDLFTPKQGVFFETGSADELSEGEAVKLSGFKIGKVSKITLEDVERVRVDLLIDKKYMKWIKAGSKAKLVKKGIIGESVLEIVPGSPVAIPVAEGQQIGFERSAGLQEMAEGLRKEAESGLSQVRGIIAYVNAPDGDFKKTLHNMQVLSAGLASTGSNADRLLTGAGKTVNGASSDIKSLTAETKKVITMTGRMVKNADHVVNKLNKDLPVLLDKAQKSMENVQKTTEDIKKAAEAGSGKITPILDKGSALEDDALQITDSVKKTWPINRHIKKEREKIIREDSYE